LIGTTTALSYSDTGLTASTTYSYTVAAFDAAGRVSSPSSPGTATTLAADTTPPTVAITAPAGNATVSSSITVSATAKDNLAVADVQFQLDGVNLGPNLTTAPYSISWDTATSSNGSHTLTAIARDTSHNSTTSTPIVITVNNTVTAQGPIGYWNFDENSGKVAHDTSGSQNNGKVSGATWTPGKVNSALSFNGVRNSVITPRIAIGTTFSVSTWVKPAGSVQGAYSRIVETQYNGGLYLGTNASGTRYKFIVNTGSGATGSCGFGFGCAEGGAITAGWHLITGTFDGATARLYVDAVMVASETFTAPPNTNYPVYIGQYYGGGYGWNGAIDEVRLYNRALAAAEVAKIASGQ
jgi:chitodextrinase